MQLNDTILTGYIDGELTPDQMAGVRDALTGDPQASARLDVLRKATDGLKLDAQALSDIAPPMPALPAITAPHKSHFGFIGTAIAACVVAAALLIAQPAKRDWMDEVASYQALYVTETLAGLDPQPPDVITTISDRIGENLTPAMQLDGLTYRRTQLLGIGGKDLVQMAYLDVNGTPFALCLIRQTDEATPLDVKSREGLASAAWSDGGHAYLLIGGDDLSVVESLAQTLQTTL